MQLLGQLNTEIENLPWKKDLSRHSLHSMCSRICSFPPSLVRYFIEKYSREGQIVFDPFSGKGTAPLEALLNGRIGWGNDVSPEAYILTKAKVSCIRKSTLIKRINQLRFLMDTTQIEETDWRVKVFYHEATLKQILQLRMLLADKKDKYAIVIKGLMLGILHGASQNSLSLRCSHSYSMSPGYVEKYTKEHGLVKPQKDVITCLLNKANECYRDGVVSLSGLATCNDSRKLKIPSESVDLIITSPPYFAVQTYASDNWLRLWFLGYNYKDVNKLQVNTNSEEKYGQFMLDSIKEMYRVLKTNSKCFIVIGDVKKKLSKGDIIINTADFLTNYAVKAGFRVDGIIVDQIPQTRKVLNSSLCSTGITTERILCLSKI
ncbi:MAG: DNA methyltransferase [archaeon]